MSVYYNDSEPYVCAWLRNLMRGGLIPEGDVDERPIQEVTPGDVRGYTHAHFFAGIGGWAYALRLAGWPDDRPLWTGSCPCGPWSVAGKHLGTGDARHLWPDWRRLITECRPPTVFGEQVASPDGIAWLDAVLADLETLGFAVGAADLCAASVGAPHIRPRLWWVADADYARREGTVGARQSSAPREERTAARREPVRSARGHWPPGPGAVHDIPLLANGLPGVVGACKGYGNAIVPQVAQAFIEAYSECHPWPTVTR